MINQRRNDTATYHKINFGTNYKRLGASLSAAALGAWLLNSVEKNYTQHRGWVGMRSIGGVPKFTGATV